MLVVCKRFEISSDAAAGIIGAGINAFTTSVRHDSITNSPNSVLVTPSSDPEVKP